MADNTQKVSDPSRRTFLKIGAGVVGGLVVGGVVGYAAKGSSPGTTTTTTETTSGVPSTSTVTSTLPGSTVTATTTSTLPGGTVTSTSTATSTVTSTLPPTTITSTVTANQSSTSTSSTSSASTTSAAATQLSQNAVFLILNPNEVTTLEAIGETLVPSDSNGPGFKEAGGIYFIDRQLAGEYGTNGNMYMDGPYVSPGQTGSLTVASATYSGAFTTSSVSNGTVTYSGGSPGVRLGAGTRFQYPIRMRQFWKIALNAVETYSNSAYGGNFETLSSANQIQALTDFYNNKPTSFSYSIPGFTTGTTVTQALEIVPQDIFYEFWMMCWSGFLMDPGYGGNQNMVGWEYVAFNGTNQGNFYGEGYTTQQLMLATTATKLQPASLGQLQQASGDGTANQEGP
jgi:Gluconate 2-dehydrogenase subunit 3